MAPLIEFFPWEYERGFSVGIARFTANWGRPDAPHYDRSKMEPDRRAQAAAALCEIAVARHLNEYAHLHVWHHAERQKYRHLPDVGEDVEVRRVRVGHGVAVRKSDAGKRVFAARVADQEFRSVEILGFVLADEVIERMEGTWQYVPLDKLKAA